jgi:geranylgeranyl pyrophosphate synthase
MPTAAAEDIAAALRRDAEDVNHRLERLFSRHAGESPRLAEAMSYSFHAGGKRLRPSLVLWCCELCGGTREAAMPAALAVECVHTFSLIHDDLPALDDDDVRRGKPANHKIFGEAMAILAGDALLALAFETLAGQTAPPTVIATMTRELAAAAGWEGMIGGEAADIEGESLPPDRSRVERIHAAKTARLIAAACRLGAIAADANAASLAALGSYGHSLGLAFQAADDLLDYAGSPETLGKRTGKDAAAGKQTYPKAVGMEAARVIAAAAVEQAVTALALFGDRASRLALLARYVLERKS